MHSDKSRINSLSLHALWNSPECGSRNPVNFYPAKSQVELQLSQSTPDAHPLPKAKGEVGKGIDLSLLLEPAFRFKLIGIFKVVFTGAQHLGI